MAGMVLGWEMPLGHGRGSAATSGIWPSVEGVPVEVGMCRRLVGVEAE